MKQNYLKENLQQKDDSLNKSQNFKNLQQSISGLQRPQSQQGNYQNLNQSNLSDLTNQQHINRSRNSGFQQISPQNNQLAQQILEVFIELRSQIDQHSSLYLRKVVPIDEKKENVALEEPTQIITYIKTITNHLVQAKNEAEEALSKKNESDCSDYESLLQKLEGEVRQHIRIEQQLKLYAENTQQKLEDTQKEKDQLEQQFSELRLKYEDAKNQNLQLNEKCKQHEKEITTMRRSFNNNSQNDNYQGQSSLQSSQQDQNIPKQKGEDHMQQQQGQIKKTTNSSNQDIDDKRTKRSSTSLFQSKNKFEVQHPQSSAQTLVDKKLGQHQQVYQIPLNSQQMSQQQNISQHNALQSARQEIPISNKDILRNSSINVEERVRQSMEKYNHLLGHQEESQPIIRPVQSSLSQYQTSDIQKEKQILDNTIQNSHQLRQQYQKQEIVKTKSTSQHHHQNAPSNNQNLRDSQQVGGVNQLSTHTQIQHQQLKQSISSQIQQQPLVQQTSQQVQPSVQPEQRNRSKSKYNQEEYQTLDSERIKNLSKKISEMQNSLSHRQNLNSTNLNQSKEIRKQDKIVPTQTLNVTQQISHHSSNNNNNSKFNVTYNNNSVNQATKPPAPTDQNNKYQMQVQQINLRGDVSRSFSVDGQSKSSVSLKKNPEIVQNNVQNQAVKTYRQEKNSYYHQK